MTHPSVRFIKDRVKERRRELKISQEDMAVELNMSKENYTKYERQVIKGICIKNIAILSPRLSNYD